MNELEEQEKPYCSNCNEDGWYLDYYGGCGDPECCGSPIKRKCYYCENDYEEDEE